MPKICVKWSGQEYEVDVNTELEPRVLKSQLFKLTGVIPDRQQVMITGIILGNESWGDIILKGGETVLMISSSDALKYEMPDQQYLSNSSYTNASLKCDDNVIADVPINTELKQLMMKECQAPVEKGQNVFPSAPIKPEIKSEINEELSAVEKEQNPGSVGVMADGCQPAVEMPSVATEELEANPPKTKNKRAKKNNRYEKNLAVLPACLLREEPPTDVNAKSQGQIVANQNDPLQYFTADERDMATFAVNDSEVQRLGKDCFSTSDEEVQ